MKNSSDKMTDQVERKAGVPDMEVEMDTLQSSWLGKQVVQSPRANVEPISVLAEQKLYVTNTKNHKLDWIWDSPVTWLLPHIADL